jgi:hypothetical protein
MGSALKREFKVGDEVCHTNKFSTGNNFQKRRKGVVLGLEKRPVKDGKLRTYIEVLWNTSSVPCFHASHALLLLSEREDAIEEASKFIAN